MAKRFRRRPSEATRYKMRLAKLGRKNPMFGRHHSEQTKRRISKALKEYWREIYDDCDILY